MRAHPRADASCRSLLFSYFNPLLRYGLERLARDARDAGVDGVLVTDLPPEEADEWLARRARRRSSTPSSWPRPPARDERLRRVAEASRGFVYAVSRTGVTGERDALSDEAAPLVDRLRALTDAAGGAGLRHLDAGAGRRAAAAVADGVVVGSALVRFLEEQPAGRRRRDRCDG